MTINLVGKKCGMTRVFTEEGVSIPVSVVEVYPHRVTQIKTLEVDGYRALQISVGSRKQSKISKPMVGHYTKAGVEPGKTIFEYRLNNDANVDISVGSEIGVDHFKEGQWVDVQGTSKGKGFAGTIKRHHFAAQDATHGNSLSHRAPGSIGQRQSPGKVFKGKKMSGHLGNVKRTIQNLKIVRIDADKKLILVSGAIPGAPGCDVIISSAVKKPQEERTN